MPGDAKPKCSTWVGKDPVSTYYVCMNLTLAVDEAVVASAREVARQQGTSLNALIREYIERLAGQLTGEQLLADLEALWDEPGNSGDGAKFDRDEIYAERLDRYKPR
jgi:hypothetical protein